MPWRNCLQVGDPALSVQISFSNRYDSFLNHNQEEVDAYFAKKL